MKLSDCVRAYEAVMAISRQEFDYKTAFSLVRLERQLRPHAKFYVEQERKLVEQYAKRDDKGIVWGENGFILQNPEKAEEYATRRKELGDVEVEDGPLVAVRLDRVSPAHLAALDGFVEFEEG